MKRSLLAALALCFSVIGWQVFAATFYSANPAFDYAVGTETSAARFGAHGPFLRASDAVVVRFSGDAASGFSGISYGFVPDDGRALYELSFISAGAGGFTAQGLFQSTASQIEHAFGSSTTLSPVNTTDPVFYQVMRISTSPSFGAGARLSLFSAEMTRSVALPVVPIGQSLATVPIPASGSVLLMALAGLVALRRRRRAC